MGTQHSPLVSPAGMGLVKPKSAYPIFQRPVTIDPPMGAKVIVRTGQIELPSMGNRDVIVQYQVPANNSAVIWRIANGTALVSYSGFIQLAAPVIWQLLVNGTPYEGLDNITSVIGLIEDGGSVLAAPIWAPQNSLIQLTIYNAFLPGSPIPAVGLLGGWRYPARLDPPSLR
jgi:hypothetical protein